MPYPVEYFPIEDHRAILNYYYLLLHELGHWTGHPQRLNRTRINTCGTKAYALEELTAELTSIFVLNSFQITNSPILEPDDYITKWQKIIAMFDGDTCCITTGELQARKACDYLFKLQNKPS